MHEHTYTHTYTEAQTLEMKKNLYQSTHMLSWTNIFWAIYSLSFAILCEQEMIYYPHQSSYKTNLHLTCGCERFYKHVEMWVFWTQDLYVFVFYISQWLLMVQILASFVWIDAIMLCSHECQIVF